MSDSAISVSTPAREDCVHLLRSVVAGVAARLGVPVDDIEDLRLAVDEACIYLLASVNAPTELAMQIDAAPGTIVVETTVHGAGPPASSQFETTLTWQLLVALADEVRFVANADGTTVRLQKRLTVPERSHS